MLGAPILSYVQKKMQHFCKVICMLVQMLLHVYRWNFFISNRVPTNFFAREANFTEKNLGNCNQAMKFRQFRNDYGIIFSVAINCSNVSRERTIWNFSPATITSAARGRVL